VDLLLTKNQLFKRVAEKFATRHRFAELAVPTVSVAGLLVLKLYALPSLYRQFDWDRIYVYESDIKLLLARYQPDVGPLFKLLARHLIPTDLLEIQKLVTEEQHRITRLEFVSLLDAHLADRGFCSDMNQLLRVGIAYDPNHAGELVKATLLSLLPER
jgi:hypothetical protein